MVTTCKGSLALVASDADTENIFSGEGHQHPADGLDIESSHRLKQRVVLKDCFVELQRRSLPFQCGRLGFHEIRPQPVVEDFREGPANAILVRGIH